MQYNNLYTYIVNRLIVELPLHLHYHNLNHIIEVVQCVEELGNSEGCNENEIQLLKTAALMHDFGFVQQKEDHEEVSCSFVRDILPGFGYSLDEIEEICRMIISTKLPQNPTNKLSQLLCDADLFYVGTDQYKTRAELLYKENVALGIPLDEKSWGLKQIDFLTNHTFYTLTAKKKYEAKKQEALQKLRSKFLPQNTIRKKGYIGQNILDACLIFFGVLFASVGLKGFLVPNKFFDGGLTGISMLLHEFYHLNLGLTILAVNIPFIIASIYTVGKRFALRTIVCVILLSISLLFIPALALTEDKLLIAIFGGVFLGMGIGLIMRTGAALDGIEVLALFTLKRTSFTISEIIMGLNVIIFSIAAFNFGIETALYSILTYFAATRTIDYVVEGIQAHTGVTIVSAKSDLIKEQLVNKLNKAITIYKGERGYLPGNFEIKSVCDIIFMVISRLEMRKIKNLVLEIDPSSFIFASTIKEAAGGILRRLHQHH